MSLLPVHEPSCLLTRKVDLLSPKSTRARPPAHLSRLVRPGPHSLSRLASPGPHTWSRLVPPCSALPQLAPPCPPAHACLIALSQSRSKTLDSWKLELVGVCNPKKTTGGSGHTTTPEGWFRSGGPYCRAAAHSKKSS
ncbi:hypothetical protein BCR44DRAFT_1438556 [Catenaria anguillulae PL171]|uniref:Uncharacterized protein n=1 Tax=Catenaria anguillulae PL171 TaxID=765915 RepID=A0A1Y2HH60_9FUNG|nr:hypothetical protein BCR44DRAFT_1438556 [Catenaria anguillulae PL171]